MLKRIRRLLNRIRYWFSRESCYDSMEDRGIAALGNCGGVFGGDRGTGYLAYSCIDCPYFVGLK